MEEVSGMKKEKKLPTLKSDRAIGVSNADARGGSVTRRASFTV